MSHFLDRLTFFRKQVDTFADGHGVVTNEPRAWEDGYRKRWQHDKIVRSTHGVNCTGSCSWKIYVKSGVVTWETQQTDYPRTRPGMPNHEPRGCARGASYSWYLYSASRIKYPLIRGRLVKAWRGVQPIPGVEEHGGDPFRLQEGRLVVVVYCTLRRGIRQVADDQGQPVGEAVEGGAAARCRDGRRRDGECHRHHRDAR